MYRVCFICIFLFCFLINAQKPGDYNAIYTKTYLETAQKDFKKALFVADSLYKTSETPYYQTKSLMLSASLYQQSGDLKKAVDYAEKSAEIIEKANNPAWETRVFGFLATQYRLLKLYYLSKKYSDKALAASKKISDPEVANNIKGLMLQEVAYYENDKKQYKKSIQKIHQAQYYFNQTIQDKDFFTSENEQLLGQNYYELKDFDKALIHYNKALKLNRKLPENYLTGLIYNGLANVYLAKKDFDNAKKHLDMAQKIAEQSKYLQLKKAIFKTSEQYYLKVKNIEKLEEIQQKKNIVEEKLSRKTTQVLNDSYSELDHKVKKHTEEKNSMLWGGVAVLMIGGTCFYQYRRKQKKNIKKFKLILEEYNKRSQITAEDTILKQDVKTTDPAETGNKNGAETGQLMTPDTERLLLIKLEKFEKSNLFISKNISLPYLAANFGTNTKYLSHIINTHRKRDFNNYINELRINYIIDKLKKDPQYRKYKMATLAEETGFSSASKFTMVFKKVTSVSPSLFVKYLQEKQEEEFQDQKAV